jgi:ribonuclease T1
MRSVRLILLVCIGLFLLYARLVSPSTSHSRTPDSTSVSSSEQPAADASVPAKVVQVLQIVRTTGEPPEGYVGGRVFQNREGRLPPGGDYREFDVDPHVGGRNAERIIVEWNTKKAWYTADHYETFTPLP